jgi:hypothetical protein
MAPFTSMLARLRTITGAVTLLVIPAMLLSGACSKSESPLCASAQDLKDSLTTLTQVSLQSTTIDELQTDVNNVKSAAAELKSQGESTFGTEITAIETQLTTLGDAITAVQGGASIKDQAATVAPALSALKTALSDLQTTAQSQDCTLE